MNHLINKTTTRMGLNLESRQAQVIFAFSAVGAYILAFIPLFPLIGPDIAILSVFPVIVAGWLFGLRIGLLVGLLSFPLNTLLLNLVGQEPGGWGVILYSGEVPGTIVAVLIGVIVGRLRDLGHELKQQLVEREQIEASLRQSEEGYHQLAVTEREQRLLFETLGRVGLALNSTLELPELLNLICQESINFFEVGSAFVWLVQGNELVGYTGYGQGQEKFSGIRLSLSDTESLAPLVVREMRPIFVNETTKSDIVNQKLSKIFQGKAMMGVPLIKEETAIGVLVIMDTHQAQRFSQADVEKAVVLGNQAAIAIQNAQLFDAEARRRREAELLHEATVALTSALDLLGVLDNILIQLEQVLPYDSACVFLHQGSRLRAVGGRGFPNPEQVIGQEYPADDELYKELQRTTRPLQLADVQAESRFQGWGDTSHIRSWLGVPLTVHQKVIGCLTLDSQQPDAYKQVDMTLIQTFANQAAIAIENARLFEATQEAHELSNSLREIGASLTATLDLEEVLNRIFDGLGKVVPYTSTSLMLIEDDILRIKAARGIPDDNPVWSYAFAINEDSVDYEIYKNKKPLIIPDVHKHPDFVEIEGTEHIRAWLGVPLIARNQVIGILNVDQDQPNFFTKEHAAIALAFAHQAAIALENARLFDETFRGAQQLTILNELAAEMTGLLEIQELCITVAQRLHSVFNYYNVAIFIADLETQELVVRINAGAYADLIRPGEYRLAIGEGIIGQAAKTGKVIVANDAQKHPDFFELKEMNIRSEMAIPLKVGGQLIGVMDVDSDQLNAFDESDVAALRTVADHLALALEKARLFAETQQWAEHLETLRQASLSLTSSLELKAVLETISKSVLALMSGAENANIFLYQSDTLTFGAALSKDGRKDKPFAEPRKDGLTYTVARQGKSIVVPNMRTHPLFVNTPSSWQGAIIGLPLKIDQRVVGVMNVASKHPRRWLETELRALELLADQAAIAIQNARLYEKVQQHTAQLEARVAERTFKLQTLYELAQTLSQATQLGEVVRLTLLELYQTLPHDVAASLLLTDTTNVLVIQSQHALTPQVETQIRRKLQETIGRISGRVIDDKPLEVHRIQPRLEDDLHPSLENLGSLMTVPIFIGDRGIGLLLVATEQESQFNEEQKQLLYIIANQAADTIGRLQSLLAAEHQRLENLVAHLPSGIIMLDSERQVVLANPPAQKLLTILKKPVQIGDMLTQVGEYPVETILGSASTDSPFTIEIEGLPSQLFEVTANPITAGLEAGGWTLVIRDVTEARGIQKRIQQQGRMAAVGQLAAGIAHDFNNILTGIIGYAELLSLDPSISPSAKGDVERISKQGQRAAHLVRQILDFSRQTISARQSLSLIPLVKETIKLLERTIPEDIHISLDAEPDDYTISGDLTQVQQALTNLAVNARDAMPAGGNLKFRLSQFVLQPGEESPYSELSPGNWIALAISDTGIGIPPELHQQIFEPFFTTKEVGEGTGLGLAQVYGIMRQHDGHIDVKSQPEIGTTFTLYFPALLSPAASPQENIIEVPRGDNEVILLVEDDSSVLAITTNILQHLGYRVLTAKNGHQALEVYDQHQSEIALVLTDMTMPQMGGAELTLALRERNPAIKVVGLTGYPLDSKAKDALVQGIVDWLQKPLGLKELAHTISRSLNIEEEIS